MTHTPEQLDAIVAGFDNLEREWIAGWSGPKGAAFNAIAASMKARGLLNGASDWNLNSLGQAVRARMMEVK